MPTRSNSLPALYVFISSTMNLHDAPQKCQPKYVLDVMSSV